MMERDVQRNNLRSEWAYSMRPTSPIWSLHAELDYIVESDWLWPTVEIL